MAKWTIESEESRHARWREQWGDAGFERRLRIAAEKRDQYPKGQWEASIAVGNQFDAIAMAASQEIFDKLAEKDYKFWERLVFKVAGI